jgi:post-segregation antitoxin (ccd killing protein)
MARVNVYLPDELAEAARRASLNISALTQEAIKRELDHTALQRWLAEVTAKPPIEIPHDVVIAAIDAAREERGSDTD